MLNAERQEVVDAMNGIRAVNGLTSANGIRAVNGLSSTNGMRAVNGLISINGLKTVNGMRAVNGLDVDCTDKTAGVDCIGTPDGLMSAATGMMSSDDGINTAKYLVRCALPAGRSLRLKDYTGALVSLSGELGLTPEWEYDYCDSACQQKISACLMSLTNTAGKHVNVELSAPFTLGLGNSPDHPYQEAVFYGNLFDSPPRGNFAIGKDFQGVNVFGLANVGVVANRMCGVIFGFYGNETCPYKEAGAANFMLTDPVGISSNKCLMFGGAAFRCKDKAGTTWSYPITTYRMSRGDR